jgi:hypothetical protein
MVAVREHAAVLIKLRIHHREILGMVTLGHDKERVVCTDVPNHGRRVAGEHRTGERVGPGDEGQQESKQEEPTAVHTDSSDATLHYFRNSPEIFHYCKG